jgi:hypothetical protein
MIKQVKNTHFLSDSIKLLERPTTVLNYCSSPSLLVPIGVTCTWKCEGCINKQHSDNYSYISVTIDEIIEQYRKNTIVESIVFAGLEPLDNLTQLYKTIIEFRRYFIDDIVIYSGYEVDELLKLEEYDTFLNLWSINGIILKLGRYIPNGTKIYNNDLKIYLQSDNQYTIRSF